MSIYDIYTLFFLKERHGAAGAVEVVVAAEQLRAGEVAPHPADGPAVGHHGDGHADEELEGEFLNHWCSCWRRSSARPSPCASSPCSGAGQFFLLLGCF
jgi:hypothetical protein